MRRALTAAAFAVLAGVAYLGATHDTSPLARSRFAVERDVPYGPDPRQRLDLVRVDGPLLLFIHPGGWRSGDKSAYHRWMLHFAERGYATASVNFRFGRHPAAIDDVRAALAWLRANVKPSRIGVCGWSSGAHLALLLALDGGGVQAAVGVSGPYDFLMPASGAFPNREDDPNLLAYLGATPSADPERARKASPYHHLTPDDPPLLLIHGEADRVVDVEQARHLARKAKDVELIVLPGADHGRDCFPAEALKRVEAFLARRLKP
jgi:acetyl esterase/lipase